MESIAKELTDVEHEVMYGVGMWYNGIRFLEDEYGRDVGMADHHPPDLAEYIADALSEPIESFNEAIESLRDDGLLKTEYICRRKVDWAPTRAGRQYINEVYAGEFRDLMHWNVDEDASGALIGDWNESLYHRTGVETAAVHFTRFDWVDTVHLYPGEPGQERADLLVKTVDEIDLGDWDVEVLTSHNNYDDYMLKYEFLAQRENNALLLFDSRKRCFEMLNWIQDPDVENNADLVNGTFRNPQNWSIDKGNEYIYRSHSNPEYCCPGVDMVDTITRWVESDTESIDQQFYKFFTEH